LKSEERIQVLTKLGFTLDQARIYHALVQEGPATVKKVAEISKITRPDIYRIIPTLQKKGVIEKLLTKPASFQAIPTNYVLPSLLKCKTAEINKLKMQTKKIIGDFQNTCAKGVQEANAEFSVIFGKEAIIHGLKEKLLKTQISLSVVTSQNRFSARILEFEKSYRKILNKGVKISIATNRHVPHKRALKTIQNLMEDPNFEVKYFDGVPSTIVTIFDNKEASVTLSETATDAVASAVWSNNPCFVSLVQSYFENKWNQASY